MRASITLKSKNNGYTKKPVIFSVGGFEFVVNNKSIRFDWYRAYSDVSIEPDGTLIVKVELREFDTDTYAKDYSRMGIEVTAQLLASADKIEEIFYDCYADYQEMEFIPLKVTSFSIDGIPVREAVLQNYERDRT